MRALIAAGHRNFTGGNAYERQTTGLLTPHIARACRARGIEVKTVQPDDGAGEFQGRLDNVGRAAVALAQQGWMPDVFLETHTDSASVRGVFAIYPDWPSAGDTDTGVRDRLGPDLARRVSQRTGMPVRFVDGLMSERSTGVGSQGSRLAVFRVTEPIKTACTRLLVEYGSHGNRIDAALHRDPEWLQQAGEATADALAAYGGSSAPIASQTTPIRTWQDIATAHHREHEARFGPIFYPIELRQPDWTGEASVLGYRCRDGYIVVVRGEAWELTGRVLDVGQDSLKASGQLIERHDQ